MRLGTETGTLTYEQGQEEGQEYPPSTRRLTLHHGGAKAGVQYSLAIGTVEASLRYSSARNRPRRRCYVGSEAIQMLMLVNIRQFVALYMVGNFVCDLTQVVNPVYSTNKALIYAGILRSEPTHKSACITNPPPSAQKLLRHDRRMVSERTSIR